MGCSSTPLIYVIYNLSIVNANWTTTATRKVQIGPGRRLGDMPFARDCEGRLPLQNQALEYRGSVTNTASIYERSISLGPL